MKERATANDVPFTPLDKLFEPTVPQGPELPAVDTLPVEDLRPFSGHPFHLYTDEKLRELTDSIREHGVLMPVLVRPLDGGYEIVSGHNRVEAAKLAGLDKVPVTVRELDDDTATILMVDSNLRQRETLLPSEKAWAYRMKLEAMRHQGVRTSAQVEPKLRRSNELLASQSPDSRATIQRYIRLTELIPPFLDMVDNGRLAFNPAVELSYLQPSEQETLFSIMDCDEVTPSLSQAQRLRRMSEEQRFTDSAVMQLMSEVKGNQVEYVKVPVDKLRGFFRPDTSVKQMTETLVKAMDFYNKHLARQRKDRDAR